MTPQPGQSALFPTYPYKKPVSQMSYASLGAGQKVIDFTPETLKMLEDWLAWAENVERHKILEAEDLLALVMVTMCYQYAQKFSAGMRRDPKDTSRSWKWPIPRVTGRYFAAWQMQRVRQGTYILTNNSREAYFIEYGIHRNPRTGQPSPRRIRRPVLKRSLLETTRMLQSSALSHRLWSGVFIPKHGEPGKRTNMIVWSQPSGVMGTQPQYLVSRAGMFEIVQNAIPTVLTK